MKGDGEIGISAERRAEPERKGARETTVQELFDLDDADMQVVELRVRLAKEVRRRREAANLSQKGLAERMHVSQPRIPAIESGASTSLEAVVLAYLATGGSMEELGAVVGGGS